MLNKKKLKTLLEKAPRYRDGPLPGGASLPELQRFSERTGIALPNDLSAWYRFCNGPCVSPAGFFGIATADPFLDIENVYRSLPDWKNKGWVPITHQGGNYYIVLTKEESGRGFPIFYVAADHDYSPRFICASDLSHFLEFFLEAEIAFQGLSPQTLSQHMRYRRETPSILSIDDSLMPAWPFNKEFVVARDPAILRFPTELLPWEVNNEST